MTDKLPSFYDEGVSPEQYVQSVLYEFQNMSFY